MGNDYISGSCIGPKGTVGMGDIASSGLSFMELFKLRWRDRKRTTNFKRLWGR